MGANKNIYIPSTKDHLQCASPRPENALKFWATHVTKARLGNLQRSATRSWSLFFPAPFSGNRFSSLKIYPLFFCHASGPGCLGVTQHLHVLLGPKRLGRKKNNKVRVHPQHQGRSSLTFVFVSQLPAFSSALLYEPAPP